jgi:glycerol-3-phosphate dehydrogenase (NAD(P)+)
MEKFENIAVYGGGGWGCALACQVARTQNQAMLYLRSEQTASEIANHHTNKKYLGDATFAANIIPTTNLEKILSCDLIIIAVSSCSFAQVITTLKNADLNPNTALLVATKGLSNSPVELLSDKLKSCLKNPFAFISGPNFAKEVVADLLTPATIAAEDLELANKISRSLASPNFILNTTQDIITVQIAGAMKNIIAIKSGMFEGYGYKENAKAGLITDGLKEIMDLSIAMGGESSTMLTPAVLGDLMLTCYSQTSRNTKFGYEFAKATDHTSFLNSYPHLIEGKESAPLVLALAEKYHVKLPIIASVVEALKS